MLRRSCFQSCQGLNNPLLLGPHKLMNALFGYCQWRDHFNFTCCYHNTCFGGTRTTSNLIRKG